jgi:hypothetical protein
MNKPYPGYQPNYKQVTSVGGYHRNCLVLDVLSLDSLDDAEIAMIEEQLSALTGKLAKSMPNIHKIEVITPSRFDKIVRDGLRLG